MKKLLVIADRTQDSQKAFGKALKLAGKTGAAIHVAIFLYEPETVLSAISEQHSEFSGDDLKAQMMGRKTQWWQEYISTHRGELEITHEVVWGKYIHDWVVKHAGKHRYYMVIKTGNRSENLFYTPTDWQLFRDLSVPVYITSSKQFKPRKVVLVSLDMLAKSVKKKNLNRQLLECANRMAAQTDAVLHCVFVIKVPTILKDLDLINTDTYVQEELLWKLSRCLSLRLVPRRVDVTRGRQLSHQAEMSHNRLSQILCPGRKLREDFQHGSGQLCLGQPDAHPTSSHLCEHSSVKHQQFLIILSGPRAQQRGAQLRGLPVQPRYQYLLFRSAGSSPARNRRSKAYRPLVHPFHCPVRFILRPRQRRSRESLNKDSVLDVSRKPARS